MLADPPPFLFFTGKGGVGKTSTAAATAVALADAGARVLIVSTDPASNLDEVLGVAAGTSSAPVPVPRVAGLWAVNIDPQAAAAAYRERVVGPYRGVLPAVAVAQMDEGLSGSCTVEVAAFNEFVALLADAHVTARFDHVVFDTAPTGHTLRLLTLPAAWTGFLATNTAGVTCIGPVSAMGQAREDYAAALTALRDPGRTTVIMVTRPDTAAIAEAARASAELAALGLQRQHLVLNGVFTSINNTGSPGGADPVAAAWAARGERALAELPASLAGLATEKVPLLAIPPIGVPGLRGLLHPDGTTLTATDRHRPDGGWRLADLVDAVECGGPGVVMTMGKGGVGKTTVAAAVAVALARRGHPVTLTTTDPAAHVDAVLPDPPPNLTVTRIDPVAESAAYQQAVLASAGAGLGEQAYALLEEDLRSPCTEEVAVFQAFARTVAGATDRYVVIDTAPTGHTLLLLDASRSFTRQLASQSGQVSDAAAGLLDTLTDQDRTRILLVTLPEATPVHEAAALEADLARAGIHPYAWVVNASLAATTTTDPLLQARAGQEHRWLGEVIDRSARPPAVIAWSPVPPVGVAGLAALAAP